MFKNTNVFVTDSGRRHLGAVIGSVEYKEEFVKGKVREWIKEMYTLSNFAQTEPHAAYTAFTFGLKHKWTYLSRTIPQIETMLQPLEEAIRNVFIPAITKGHNCTDVERDLLALTPRLGGLGIINPTKLAKAEYSNSMKLTSSLSAHIQSQNASGDIDENKIYKLKIEISKDRQEAHEQELKSIIPLLSTKMKKKVEMAQETGASNWLSSLPIKAKGFSLNKQEFRDAVALRYG